MTEWTNCKNPRLTKAETTIVRAHFQAYLYGSESCEVAMKRSVHEVREHILKAFEVHVGGDPTRVFVDSVAKTEFLALVDKLRGQR